MFEKYNDKYPIVNIVGNDNGLLINQHGTVYDRNYVEVPRALNSVGEPIIEIQFLGVFKTHRIIDLVACHFKWLIPTYVLLNNVRGFPIDGDILNTHASNVAYRLATYPLEHPKIPQCYYIPGYPRMVINRMGKLVDETTKRCPSFQISKPTKDNPKNITGGYHYIRKSIDGVTFNVSRHRAMLLAFKAIPDDIENLVANHIDGVPGNDTLDNLEWVTRKRNLTHAYEENLRRQNKPVYTKHIVTGKVDAYHSVEEAARACGVSGSLFNLMLEEYEFGHFNQKGYQIKYQTDERDWITIDNPKSVLDKKVQAIPVKVRNCETGIEALYSSSGKASQATGIKAATISKRLTKGDASPCFGYQFMTSDEQVFPAFTKETLEASLIPSRVQIDARNFLTGETRTYDSIAKAEVAHGVSTIASGLRDGVQPKFASGWTFKTTEDDWDEIKDPQALSLQLTKVVSAKNIDTGVVVTANSVRSLAKQLDIDAKAIVRRLYPNEMRPYEGYLFIKGDDLTEFDNYNPNCNKPFTVTSPSGIVTYCTIGEAVNLTGFAKPTLYRRLREGNCMLPDGSVIENTKRC